MADEFQMKWKTSSSFGIRGEPRARRDKGITTVLYQEGSFVGTYEAVDGTTKSGGINTMSQGRRPMLGAVGGSYLQPGGQYMNQQMPMGPGSNPGPPHQRFMMMPNHMYGHSMSQSQMYMASSQQQSGASLSPVGRPLTPQQPQLQHMVQNMVQNSPTQLSPVPSVSSDHGLSHENNIEDPSGENSRSSTGVPQPSPSPVGSAGSRSNTPASISGARAGSPMPIHPPPGQVDGQSRFTQSPMATQGFGQQIMPPPNSMGYMPASGKMGGSQIPGHIPQYGTQFPQGNYSRQPNMATSGPPQPGSMQSYPGTPPNMYPSNPGQMPVTPMYGNMPGMVRNMGQQAYNPSAGQGPYSQSNTGMGGMLNSHYPGYNSHMGPMAGHHSMQQTPGGSGHMPPGSAVAPTMGGQQGGMMSQQHVSSNKGAPAVMLTAAGSVGPQISHSRGSMSPSRGMFMQAGEGPLAHMNNMMNSPNLGSSSLNINSNTVEHLSRSGLVMGSLSTSTPSPVPHFPAALTNTSSSVVNSGDHSNSRTSPLLNAEAHDPLSRPGSVAARHPDLPSESTMGSDSSGGMPSDSTSVDSGFHSSDQSDKTSDSVSTPTQSGSSPPLSCHPANGDASRTIENISPPDHTSHPPPHHLQHHHHLHQQHMQQQHYHMEPEPKMPYSSDGGVSLPPAAMSLMPLSCSSVVTTANAGPSLTSVTQSIASPVASISTSIPPNHPHPHTHHMGPHGGPPHMIPHGMGPGTLGMMPNGMPPAGMANPGQVGGPGQMRPSIGGPMQGMMPQNMGGPNMNVNQNGPLMTPMMSHNGPMLSGHLGMNSGGNNNNNMIPMGQMAPQQQMNCMPAMASTKSSSKNTSDETPGKKKKLKDSESQGGQRAGSMGLHYSEEPNSPGALKNALDLNKLFEMGPEPDRRHFLERIFAFLEENGQPVTALPVISKTPLDLYKLYFSVKEKGGFEEITRSKKWRDICTAVNIGTSASAAFTLKKNYIRYLFNYECKFDRGGINPAPILAQMEAQLAHKREQKKRAPSPAGSNSNDSFRPPSVPNSQMDSPYQPSNMPPPYMQNQDGNMPDPHVSGNLMMGSGNMMGGPGPHGGMGGMMTGPPGVRPPGMMGAGMMHRQQGMIPNAGTGNMMGSQMAGGAPGYGGPMMQSPMSLSASGGASGPPFPSHGGLSATGSIPITSDSITAQDPFAVDSGYLHPRGGPLQPTPPPQTLPTVTTTPLVSGYPGAQPSTMGNTALTNTSTQSGAPPSAGYAGPDQMMSGFHPNSGQSTEPPVSTSSGQFNFGQQFERSDRFDQSTPGMMIRPPGPAPGMTPSQPPPQHAVDSNPAYSGTRFQSVGMRPQGGDVSGQYPQPGNTYQNQGGYPGHQYPGYPQNAVGPRPPPGSGGMYGTPTKRFTDDQTASNQYTDWSNSVIGTQLGYPAAPADRQASSPDDRLREGQWSPMQRSHGPQNGPSYMTPAAPSTPPIGQYCQQMSHKHSSPQSRDGGRYPGPQKALPSHGGMAVASFARKEVTFPPDCIESVGISTARRKKLTSKDLAPFESWRLMMALKSGLLAESTWALDTLNILLYDDATVGYFGLNKLPGMLEVLTDHLRHCLAQMFGEFEDLEEGLAHKNISHRDSLKPLSLFTVKPGSLKDSSELKDEPTSFFLSGSNYTMVSKKGLPVKIEPNPADSSVLDAKDWDVFCNFSLKSDYWVTGCGDITKHILTHLESANTNKFLSGRFRRKRTREEDSSENAGSLSVLKQKKNCLSGKTVLVSASPGAENQNCSGQCVVDKNAEQRVKCDKSLLLNSECVEKENCDVKSELPPQESLREYSNSEESNSAICSDGTVCEEKPPCADSVHAQHEVMHTSKPHSKEVYDESEERSKAYSKDKVKEKKKKVKKVADGKTEAQKAQVVVSVEMLQIEAGNLKAEPIEVEPASANSKPLENGDVEEPRLSPILNCESAKDTSSVSEMNHSCELNIHKAGDGNNGNSNSSPPVLRAESVDGSDMINEAASEAMNSAANGNTGAGMDANVTAIEDTSYCKENEKIEAEESEMEEGVKKQKDDADGVLNDSCGNNSADASQVLNESFTSESEELSASIVAEMLKEDEHLEEEAFHRDDPPLCVTPESKDELGRRCVCISNIIRSLSCIPGNEEHICKHAGIMRILGRLMLLHHSHPVKPPMRKLPCEVEEEDREQLPRVYDDEHWWWDYLDQLRENALVIMANICSHLKLANFPEQICFPLLEGLIHWVICPASVARDPLPTLPAGSVLSPQRLVLEALCKLCIHETNVDLLLATPPVKRILELFGVLVHLLADRNHQITREFSIVLLSLLVSSESSAARAVALQHASVSLLVDFIETAEQNALSIANQQGIEVLQVNPEVMGTSLDMLRRAASILLHMARVPDNHKLFVQQQNRLLNLVMSQILDQSVSNTLSEVLFECSQLS